MVNAFGIFRVNFNQTVGAEKPMARIPPRCRTPTRKPAIGKRQSTISNSDQ